MKEKTEKQPKPKKEKQERTPREATALMLGLVALHHREEGHRFYHRKCRCSIVALAVHTGGSHSGRHCRADWFCQPDGGKKRNPAGNCCRSGRLFDRTICDHFYEDAVT